MAISVAAGRVRKRENPIADYAGQQEPLNKNEPFIKVDTKQGKTKMNREPKVGNTKNTKLERHKGKRVETPRRDTERLRQYIHKLGNTVGTN